MMNERLVLSTTENCLSDNAHGRYFCGTIFVLIGAFVKNKLAKLR
jgi:hypothetical protein